MNITDAYTIIRNNTDVRFEDALRLLQHAGEITCIHNYTIYTGDVSVCDPITAFERLGVTIPK